MRASSCGQSRWPDGRVRIRGQLGPEALILQLAMTQHKRRRNLPREIGKLLDVGRSRRTSLGPCTLHVAPFHAIGPDTGRQASSRSTGWPGWPGSP